MTDPSAPNANTETVESVDDFAAFVDAVIAHVDADLADPDAAVWGDPVWDMSEHAFAQHLAANDPRGFALATLTGSGHHETPAKREAWRVAADTARRRLSHRDRIYLRRVERTRSARHRPSIANRAPRASRRASRTSSAAASTSPGSGSGSDDPEPPSSGSPHRTPAEVRP
jgi:hypothetical protein